jgi:hypothetical protein
MLTFDYLPGTRHVLARRSFLFFEVGGSGQEIVDGAVAGRMVECTKKTHMACDDGGSKAPKPKPIGGRQRENLISLEDLTAKLRALLARLAVSFRFTVGIDEIQDDLAAILIDLRGVFGLLAEPAPDRSVELKLGIHLFERRGESRSGGRVVKIDERGFGAVAQGHFGIETDDLGANIIPDA